MTLVSAPQAVVFCVRAVVSALQAGVSCVRARAVVVSLTAVLLTGCGEAGFSGLYNAPLPGGADVGDDPYRVTVQLADVLDLVPQATVKVNDVAVGRVDRIRLAPDTKSALVEVVVNGDVKLPANAIAELRQSSLLGEKFIDLRPPADAKPRGELNDGALIPLERTARYPELEEVFGALSLLLSGGGVEQLRTIASELNDAFSGNEAEIKALLRRVDHLAGRLDGKKEEIVAAIEGLNKLAKTLKQEKRNLTKSLDELAPGVRVVAEQRKQLVGMLKALKRLSDVSVDTIGKSRANLVANLRALEPTLRKLADAGPDLVEALKILPTYPLPWNAGNTMFGDFANVDVEFDLNLDTLVNNIVNSGRLPWDTSGQDPDPAEVLPDKGGPELPELPETPNVTVPGSGLDDLFDALLGPLGGGGR